jgi:hypothetical protein
LFVASRAAIMSLAELAADYEALHSPVEVDELAWRAVHAQLDAMDVHVRDLARTVFQATPGASTASLAAAVSEDVRHVRDALETMKQRFRVQRENLEHFLVGAILFQTTGHHGLDQPPGRSVEMPLASGVPALGPAHAATFTTL